MIIDILTGYDYILLLYYYTIKNSTIKVWEPSEEYTHLVLEGKAHFYKWWEYATSYNW